MTTPYRQPVRYRAGDDDSARWRGFPYRAGDIVISTRSKSGTTWTQMICALLVFQRPELPARLPELSPWLDWTGEPVERVFGRLAAQRHRRFIKTHTPLDGLPLDPRATYLVVARHPLDVAVSLYHHGDNLDRDRLRELTGQPAPTGPESPRPPLLEWLRSWIDREVTPVDQLDSLPGICWHLTDAWRRRDAGANVVLLHYDDLLTDLEGQMRALADRLEIEVPADRWEELVAAAGFAQMRARAEQLAPDPADIITDRTGFFRRGGSGAGRALLSATDVTRYHARAARLLPPDLYDWLHRD